MIVSGLLYVIVTWLRVIVIRVLGLLYRIWTTLRAIVSGLLYVRLYLDYFTYHCNGTTLRVIVMRPPFRRRRAWEPHRAAVDVLLPGAALWPSRPDGGRATIHRDGPRAHADPHRAVCRQGAHIQGRCLASAVAGAAVTGGVTGSCHRQLSLAAVTGSWHWRRCHRRCHRQLSLAAVTGAVTGAVAGSCRRQLSPALSPAAVAGSCRRRQLSPAAVAGGYLLLGPSVSLKMHYNLDWSMCRRRI